MKSRTKFKRPQGTDGQDYSYCEKVADRYKLSAKTKNTIHKLLYIQFLFYFVNVFRFLIYNIEYLQI